MTAAEPKVDAALALEHGLSEDEYQRILDSLGRTPSYTELGVFSVMWSEHCSYKSSRVHLGRLPTEGPQVVQGPGENAGIVDIGDGEAIAFKMESHNHPSYIEPYQGAATGVGGILRDVFTMGARPIANLNSLRFGEPSHPKTAWLLGGVVGGIADYGNCTGVPTVAGEATFMPCYNGNILVNAMTAGYIRTDAIFRGFAAGVGNPVIYVGAKTGRDGIHGATMASDEFSEEKEAKRPTVQVGDPFTEKKLIEACLELMNTDAIVGIQDMGAAGLTSSSTEMASRAGSGIKLDLDNLPVREVGITPYEALLSESQERMLIVARVGREDDVRAIFEKWELDAVVIGEVIEEPALVVTNGGKEYANIPIAELVHAAPSYERPLERPDWLDSLNLLEMDQVPIPTDLGATLLQLVGSPNLGSKHPIFSQYDHMVQINTLQRPGGDAAVVRIRGGKKAVAFTSDVNPRYCQLDPYLGAAHAVAEAARNITAVGGKPLAITDCLNFGNPERPAIMWQFSQAIDGMGEACRVLDTPVVGGNVSFYNETDGRAIYPTPTVGMVGLLPDASRAVGSSFTGAGDAIILIGCTAPQLGASEYLSQIHGQDRGTPPPLDLEAEKTVQDALRALINDGKIKSAHDISDGGFAVALAECCIAGPRKLRMPRIGAVVSLAAGGLRADEALFGECAGSFVISCAVENADSVVAELDDKGASARRIGETGGERLTITVSDTTGGDARIDLALVDIHQAFETALDPITG